MLYKNYYKINNSNKIIIFVVNSLILSYLLSKDLSYLPVTSQ